MYFSLVIFVEYSCIPQFCLLQVLPHAAFSRRDELAKSSRNWFTSPGMKFSAD